MRDTCLAESTLWGFPPRALSLFISDLTCTQMPKSECWWGLAEFATGKAVGMEDRVPTGTGHHGLPSASFDLPPKGLPTGQSPHT